METNEHHLILIDDNPIILNVQVIGFCSYVVKEMILVTPVLLLHFKCTSQNDPHSRFVSVILQILGTRKVTSKTFILFQTTIYPCGYLIHN